MLLSLIPPLSGKVIHGEKVGRQMGFPTINLDVLPQDELPKGVYIGSCILKEQKHDCLAYFGPRLIFGEQKNCFEAYIYDFNEEVYGEEVEVQLFTFIRPPMPFTTLAALQAQLEQDKMKGREELQKIHVHETPLP
jgi:riboflavin kinase/FMN adenylyltransferase